MTKIVALEAENVKRLKAVRIEPDGELVIVGGDNGQGKTSVLDSIAYALAGKSAIPAQPIREGEDEAEVTVETEKHRIVRKWSRHPDGGTRTSLKVTELGAETAEKSPQTLLDEIVGSLSFDPLAFSRMAPKDQAETLRELVGLDVSDLETEYEKIYEKRAGVNREVKALEARTKVGGYPADTPAEPVSTADLVKELGEIQEANAGRRLEETALDSQEKLIASLNRKRSDTLAEVDRLTSALEAAKGELVEMEKEVLDASQALEAQIAEFKEGDYVDEQPILDRISQADTVNEAVRTRQAHELELAELKAKRKEADNYTRELKNNQKEKARRIGEADYPIEGLELAGEIVKLNGLPLDQASGAEQLRLSVAMGLALNPELRVLLVRDGSLLDSTSLELVRSMAAEADAQVWLERVGKGAEASVIIEDGEVVPAATQ